MVQVRLPPPGPHASLSPVFSVSIFPPLPGGRSAAQVMRAQSKGRGWVYVSPRCFAHPGPRAFWLGGGCKGGQLSEGRRA